LLKSSLFFPQLPWVSPLEPHPRRRVQRKSPTPLFSWRTEGLPVLPCFPPPMFFSFFFSLPRPGRKRGGFIPAPFLFPRPLCFLLTKLCLPGLYDPPFFSVFLIHPLGDPFFFFSPLQRSLIRELVRLSSPHYTSSSSIHQAGAIPDCQVGVGLSKHTMLMSPFLRLSRGAVSVS